MNFVEMLLELTKEYESPTSFWKWSAYSAVAATLRNNIYIQHGIGRVYPNIYTLLIAPSGERKDPPLNLMSEILRAVGTTKIIEGRSTHQGIAEILCYDTANKATGIALKGGCALVISPEFSAGFNKDPQLVEVLTAWYDYRDIDYINLKMGKSIIKDRCLNILAASNEVLLRGLYTANAIQGGLIRRTFFIKPDETRPPNSLFEMQQYDKRPLIESLKCISQIKGPIAITRDAVEYYNDWYYRLYRSYKIIGDKTGVVQSLHTSVLKLAMIKAGVNLSLNIDKPLMEESIDEVNQLKTNYKEYALGNGKSNLGEATKMVLALMYQAKDHKLTRRAILATLWGDLTAEDLDKIFETMGQAGLIQISNNGHGDHYYILTTDALNQLK